MKKYSLISGSHILCITASLLIIIVTVVSCDNQVTQFQKDPLPEEVIFIPFRQSYTTGIKIDKHRKISSEEVPSEFGCALSTLSESSSARLYRYQAFYITFPKEVMDDANGKVIHRYFVLRSDRAKERTPRFANLDGVVRYLTCRIPDSPKAIEILENEMQKFGTQSWYNDLDSSKKIHKKGGEWTCKYVPGDGYGNTSSTITIGGDVYVTYYFHEECSYEYTGSGGGGGDGPAEPEFNDPFGGGGGDIGDPDDTNENPDPCLSVEGRQYPVTNEVIGCGSLKGIRAEQLKDLLEENEFALLDIPCSEIPKWQDLAQFAPPQAVMDKLNSLDENYTSIISGDWDIQYIEEAEGAVVNMDYFPVSISNLPNNPSTGQPFTASEFLEYIRTHLDDFFDGNSTVFGPYNSAENQIWHSDNYLGAIMRFDISIEVGGITFGQQDGSVITSAQGEQNWNFTTIESPADWNHPVSGTRKFGYTQNVDGSYTFYTRGIDRVAESFDEFVGNYTPAAGAFEGADALWNTFKENVYEFVENNSGNAQQPLETDNAIYRPNWDEVSDFIMGSYTRTVTDLGCN